MFYLDNLIPIPLYDQVEFSQIWGTNYTFSSKKKYFVEAASGKGKTTLQHILYGLRKDYSGKVQISINEAKSNLTDLTFLQWAQIRQSELAVVFQDLRLFVRLTANENLLLKNNLTNYKSKKEIFEMAKALGVDSLMEKKCGEMSYGQRQRIAIIRSLCQPFKFLIMDEPFSHLDTLNVKKCCNLINEECKKQNAGFLIASLEEKYFFDYDYEVKI
ncbi:MAG: ATP-binding cassette domain-containing protein [Saprospiraceae bacterium]|nr:ATP-binding cassette domain-containing protein [Saprospiraceae bacterium]